MSTAQKYTHKLSEIGLTGKTNGKWTAWPVYGIWTSELTVGIGPVVIAVYGATAISGDLSRYADRHGQEAIIPAVSATIKYLRGDLTRRGDATELNVSMAEGIAVTQAIEPIVAVVRDFDPLLRDASFEVDVHARVLDKAPYHVVN
ncbi:DUF7437 domain-containing protein [Halogeometricum luteum]|uniref:DUF7437 domain-containing protein n=1 Tax=Halogeometricum luteum TaxID=2950537 RepID=UPI003CCD68C6